MIQIFLPKIKSIIIFAIAMPRVFMDKFSFFMFWKTELIFKVVVDCEISTK